MYRYLYILLFCFLIFSCQQQEKKQNVIFILIDDLGWNDLGYSGSTFHETPNIDAFSTESIQFTNADLMHDSYNYFAIDSLTLLLRKGYEYKENYGCMEFNSYSRCYK